MTRIRYVETLVYYDGPQVFEARDAIGGHYIALLGPSDTETRYLVAGVSPLQLAAFRSGEIDLLDLVERSDADSRYTTTSMPLSADTELAVEVFEGPLEGSGFLPEPGYVLKSPSLEPQVVRASDRRNLRLELILAAMSRIGTTAYTELLSRVQILVKHAALAVEPDEGTERSPIRRRDDVFDVVIPASAGSFRVQLEASGQHGPEFNTRMAAALHRVDRLFRDSADTAEVLRAARENPRRLTWAYLKLLRLLVKNRTDLSYTWSGAYGDRSHNGAVSSAQAQTLIRALARERLGGETVVLEGKLYRCNSGTGFWGLETADVRLRGRVKEGGPSLDGLHVGGRYKFTCDVEHDFVATSSGYGGQLYLIRHEPLSTEEDAAGPPVERGI